MANETTKGMAASFTGAANTAIQDASLDNAGNMVDCTALADTSVDMRLAQKNPNGTYTCLLGKGASIPSLGDVGDYTVDGQTAKMMVSNVRTGGGVGAARTATVTLVSTLET